MGKMVICDDDRNTTEVVRKYVQDIFVSHNISMEMTLFTDTGDAFSYCKTHETDFILLDINMPNMDGFELTRRLQSLPRRNVPIVIFMSCHEQLVYDVFQYHPFDFLRKSCLKSDLKKKLERLICEYHYSSESVALIRGEDAHVRMKDIFYFKSDRNHVTAHTADGEYRCRDTISAMEVKYENCLIRSDRQYLVNVTYICKIGFQDILLKDGRRVPISRRRRKFVDEKYERLMKKS